MRVILLSGGAGKRLWPLSAGNVPKQFYPLFKDEKSQPMSMIQRIWRQLHRTGLYRVTSICAGQDQVGLIQEQLGNVSIIQEPKRKDTFGAVALATLASASFFEMRDEETILILPADHLVDDEFYREASKLPTSLKFSRSDFAVLGIRPDSPRTKFGYLLPGNVTAPGTLIGGFIEKPSTASAERLVQSGALWNAGVYCFSIGYLKKTLKTLGYPINYREFMDHYDDLPVASFDKMVAENAEQIIAKTYVGSWTDLGTWDAFLAAGEIESKGKAVLQECEQTYIVNELPLPIIANGLQGIVVVATKDGILITPNTATDTIKEALKLTG